MNAVSVAGKSGFRFGIHIAVISAHAMKSPATISSVTFPVVVMAYSIGVGRYHGRTAGTAANECPVRPLRTVVGCRP